MPPKLCVFMLVAMLLGGSSSLQARELIPRVILGECADVVVNITDDKAIVLDTNGRLTEWTLDEGRFLRDLSSIGTASGFSYLPDGRIAIQRHNGALDLYASNLSEPPVRIGEPLQYRDFRAAKTKPIIFALSRNRASLTAINVSGSAKPSALAVFQTPSGYEIANFSISPDGDAVALVDERGSTFVLGTYDSSVRPLPPTHKAEGATLLSKNKIFIWLDNSYMPRSVEYWYRDGAWVSNKETYIGVPVDVLDENEPVLFMTGAGLGFAFLYQSAIDAATPPVREKVWGLPISPSLRQVRWLNGSDTFLSCGRLLTHWEPTTNKVLWTVKSQTTDEVVTDSITKNGKLVSLADWSGRTAIWNLPKSQYERELPPLKRLVFPTLSQLSEDGRIFASWGHSHILTLFRVDGPGVRVDNIPIPDTSGRDWEQDILYSAAYKTLLIKSKQEVRAMQHLDKMRDRPWPLSMIDAEQTGCESFFGRDAISPSGRFAAFGCASGGVLLLEVGTGKTQLVKLDGLQDDRQHKSWVSGLQFIGDDQLYAATRRDMIYGRDRLDKVPEKESGQLYVISRGSLTVRKLPVPLPEPITDLATDVKRRVLYLASFFGTITELDIESGKILRHIEGVAYPISSLSVDDQSGRLVVADTTSVIRSIDLGKNQAEIEVIFLKGGQFATRRQNVNFVSYPGVADQLDLEDDELLVMPGQPYVGDDINSHPVLWRRSDGQRLIASPKDITILKENDTPVLSTSSKEITKDNSDATVLAFVNGRLMGVTHGNNFEKLPLPSLENKDIVEVVSYVDKVGYGPVIRTEYQSVDKKGRMIGAFVGIDRYSDKSFKPLSYAAKDARALSEAFSNSTNASRADMHVFPETTQASASEVLSFLTNVAQSTKPEDTFVIFLSGHGKKTDNSHFYLAAADAHTNPSAPEGMDGVLWSESILNIAKNVPAKNVLILIDACEAGQFNAEWNTAYLASGLSNFFGMRLMSADKSVYVAAAAPEYQQAIEGWKSGGVFATVVAEILASKDLRKTEPLTAASLLYFLAERVTARFRAESEGQDIRPILSFGTSDFELKPALE